MLGRFSCFLVLLYFEAFAEVSIQGGHSTGMIRWENQEYFTEGIENQGLASARLLSARASLSYERNGFQFATDIVGGSFLSRGQSYVLFPELFLEMEKSDISSWALGRKHIPWSQIDSFWALGLWEPTFYIDGLRPEVLGLAGVIFDTELYEKVGLSILYSPIYIPSLGPDVRETNGRLTAETRWYRTPTRSTQIMGVDHEIDYTIDRPSENSIINNQVLAGQVRIGELENGPWFLLSWAQKPINELSYRYSFTMLPNSRGHAVVSPVVAYHRIWSMDWGYTLEGAKLVVSFLRDFPEERLGEKMGEVQQNLQGVSIFSIYWGMPSIRFLRQDIYLEFSKMFSLGGKFYDLRENGSPNEFNILANRLRFVDATALRLSGRIVENENGSLNVALKLLYDSEPDGTLTNLELAWALPSQLAFVSGVDLLGVLNQSNDSQGFINTFRANDRYYGGLTYVF